MAINWKNRIQKDDKYIDLQGLKKYTIKWDENSKIQKVYEFDFIIPTEQADEDCINYGLDEYDQIFRRTLIPKQVLSPKRNFGADNWTQKQLDEFIDVEWNRRRNGIWIFIKGKKTYIPGLLYIKMNYWTAITNNEFIYKFSDLEFFYFWMHALYSPVCRGIIDFKCRQIGDTENVMLIMWEYGSRVRGTTNTIQSCINQEHGQGSYFRLVHGHSNMIWFFKPMNQGTTDPKGGLVLNYPAKSITASSVRENLKNNEIINANSNEDYEHPPIGSKFLFGPSKVTRFDGATGVGRAYCDEFGKSLEMDPLEWLKTMTEATYSNIYNRKMGMILMTSTVEDIGSDSLNNAMQLYEQSDPTKLSSDGSTANGLFRCFRNVVDRGEVDRWGFPMREKILKAINERYEMLIKSGDIKGAISFKRKNCITIEDVFMNANDESQFDIEKLAKRLFYIQNQAPKSLCVRGNLKWKDGIRDSEVVWEPNSKGKWMISKHPSDFGLNANQKVAGVLSYKPGNAMHFKSGVDPYDQQTVLESNPSLGAIAVKKSYNDLIDGKKENFYQHNDPDGKFRIGDPVDDGFHFVTNRIVCDYIFREADPNDFFEDIILTMVYYGCDFLPEKDKFGACHSYIKTRGYELYLMDKPTTKKNYKGQVEKEGVSATLGNIDTYFSFLTTLSSKWANTIDHPRVLEQLLSTNFKNRGKKDLSVAVGWAEYADNQPKMPPKKKQTVETIHHSEYEV